MVGVGRDPWRSPGPTHLLDQGHLELIYLGPCPGYDHIWEVWSWETSRDLPFSTRNATQGSVTATHGQVL